MEERLIRQQQEMEEDQRWLEKEERFLVTDARAMLPLLEPRGTRCPARWQEGPSCPEQERWCPLTCSSGLFACLLFPTDFFRVYF